MATSSNNTRQQRVDDTVTIPNDNHPNTPFVAAKKRRSGKKYIVGALALVLAVVGAAGAYRYQTRYGNAENVINVPLQELASDAYPEDPAPLSMLYKRYNNRQLEVEFSGENNFTLKLTSTDPDVADITFSNLDLSLFVPVSPKWVTDKATRKIAFVDREWNRQQVSFTPDSEHVTITGGDGFEKDNMYQLAVAKNCLNAGLWEIILTTMEGGSKKMYYQGWFTFPMAHYKRVFEQENQLSWWQNWHRLDHWVDPEGTTLDLASLRTVNSEQPVTVNFNPAEPIIIAGEQARKIRTVNAPSIRTWGDFLKPEAEQNIRFATFIPPGYYDHDKPWKNEYWRVARLQGGTFKNVTTPANPAANLQELELTYQDGKTGEPTKIIIGGVDFAALPQLEQQDYPKGLYMPMGIGVPPFYDSYESLKQARPAESPYYSFMLNGENGWLNHHDISIDGPVMHRDMKNPNLLHVYLLSYERHTLVAHYTVELPESVVQKAALQ